MDWAAIVVSLLALAGVIYTANQGRKAKELTTRMEQDKVDREAYKTAQAINRETVQALKEDVHRQREDIQRLKLLLAEAGRTADADRKEFEDQLAAAHEDRSIMERYLRGRIAKLEAALRDSGIPLPDGEN